MNSRKDDETILLFSHAFEPGSGDDGLPVVQSIGQQTAEPAGVTTASRETDTPNPMGYASPTGPADPTATQAPVKDDPDPVERDKPPQSQAADSAQEMRTELTHLSNLLGYQVLDEYGDKLGLPATTLSTPVKRTSFTS